MATSVTAQDTERITNFTIVTVADDANTPATISPPGPWMVTGRVRFAGPATQLVAMAYQIDDGPVKNFVPPPAQVDTFADYFCFLNTEDLQTNGPHSLRTYVWDDTNGFAQAARALQCVNFNPPPDLGGGAGFP